MTKLHYLNKRDFFERRRFPREEYKYLILKSICIDKRLDFKNRYLLRGRFLYYHYYNSKVRLRNRCLLTGRSRFVLRYLKLSRMSFRDTVSKGLLRGFIKY